MSRAEPGGPPLPPKNLMTGVGHESSSTLASEYVGVGEALREKIDALLGPEWEWPGKRMLDFGCGSGRLLRQFLDEARVAELYGSDISEEMIAWVNGNLCPPVAGARVNGIAPPLDFPAGRFDLVTATSVFTHITDGWSDWLLEMHRVLKPGGTLIATFLDRSVATALSPLAWDEERVGMSAFSFGNPDVPWPSVIHSRWWLEEHWGRAFEIAELIPGEDLVYDGYTFPTHGWLKLTARDVDLTPADLERESADDPRYSAARRYQLELLRLEGENMKLRLERPWAGARAASRLRRGGARMLGRG